MPRAAFGGLDFQARLLARRVRELRAEPALSGVIVWTLRDYALRPDFVGGSIARRRPDLRLAPGSTRRASTTSRAARSRPSKQYAARSTQTCDEHMVICHTRRATMAACPEKWSFPGGWAVPVAL